jgi:hypothetical protein
MGSFYEPPPKKKSPSKRHVLGEEKVDDILNNWNQFTENADML